MSNDLRSQLRGDGQFLEDDWERPVEWAKVSVTTVTPGPSGGRKKNWAYAGATAGLILLVTAILLIRPAELSSPSTLPANGSIVISANPASVGGGEVGDIYIVGEGTGPTTHHRFRRRRHRPSVPSILTRRSEARLRSGLRP